MSLYPILWAAEHAPIYDAEERAILTALVMKCDFDGLNAFRSYGTLAKAARVDRKTAGNKCRAMESRGLLRRQERHVSKAWLRIPDKQRPVVWEVMIPAEWWSAAQLEEINEQREGLGRPPLTRENRPPLAPAPPKKERADKGKKRPKKKPAPRPDSEADPGTHSPHPPGTTSPHPRDSQSPPPGDYKSPPQGLQVPLPSESPSEASPSESPSESKTCGSGGAQSAGGFARAGAHEGAADQADSTAGGSAADPKKSPPTSQRRQQRTTKLVPPRPVNGEEEAWQALVPVLAEIGIRSDSRPPTLRRAVRELLTAQLYPRRPEHVVARLSRGWYRAQGPERAAATYRGCPDCTDTGCTASRETCTRIVRPVGYLSELLVRHECIRPECELGILLTTGAECDECEQRKAERAIAATAARWDQERTQIGAQRAAETEEATRRAQQRATWHCQGDRCGRPGRGTPPWEQEPPQLPLCDECQAEQHRQRVAEAEEAAYTTKGPAPF